MNRAEAISKIAKLKRLALDNANMHEARAATVQADHIAKAMGLTEAELSETSFVAAFDDLISKLESLLSLKKLEGPVGGMVPNIFRLMRGCSDSEKRETLKKVVALVNTAAMFTTNETVTIIKTTIEDVLKNYGVKI